METPPLLSKKSNVSSLSKSSLTPCRRMGLSRRSSLIKRIHQNIKAETTPVQSGGLSEQSDNSTISSEVVASTLDPIFSEASKKDITLKARRCLTTPVKEAPSNFPVNLPCSTSCFNFKSQEKHESKEDSHIIKKRKLSNELVNNNKKVQNKIDLEKSDNKTQNTIEPVTDEIILKVLMSLKKKSKILDTLKVQETYAKKHNVEDLKVQTGKWKAAGQEALRYAVELARGSGYSVTIKQLMQQHGFPPHLITYNSDEDEFE